MIDRALRDEGTSYHYAKPSEYSEAEPELVVAATQAIKAKGVNVVAGSSWTTDAPFRICLAHVTNTMAVAEEDFEKGEAAGTIEALHVLEAIIGTFSKP